MRFLPAALLAALSVFLYGCISVSPPPQCAPLSAEEQPGCTYYSAVMDQSPYQCYSMADKQQREICLRDAIDPAAKRALARVPAGNAGAVLAGKVASSSATAAGAQPQQSAPQPAPPENATAGGQNATPFPPLPEQNATNQSS